ncbi:hypothetical protein [Nocardiopsis sp. LOL_012]|uniref:hypothetical protein n=1 Tax=Nocardiopsis sp. LOL_012 TaxID=3345409 RepID=UPI003A8A69F5
MTNLYGLLFHYLGNQGPPGLSAGFRGLRYGWRNDMASRYQPPDQLLVDGQTQKEEFTRIAGPYMGANYRKGHTYRRDGRLDLPDVYRIAFSIGRKGGVPKVKAP